MALWIASGLALAAGYLFGSLPTGYLAGRLVKGVDLRKIGSGSTGATNVLRTVGKWAALVVIVIDLAKGAAAILFARWLCAKMGLMEPAPWIVCLAGLAVVGGHSRSVWLGFAGGKSAATGLGVVIAMSWAVGLGSAAVFLSVLAISRIVSLSSMLGVLTAMVLICALPHPLAYRLLVLAGGAFIIFRHRTNIRRLLAGSEPRVGQTRPDLKAEI